jgi:hypothetical protein
MLRASQEPIIARDPKVSLWGKSPEESILGAGEAVAGCRGLDLWQIDLKAKLRTMAIAPISVFFGHLDLNCIWLLMVMIPVRRFILIRHSRLLKVRKRTKRFAVPRCSG